MTTFKSVEEQLAYLEKGVAEVIPEEELKQKLANSVKTGKALRVYLGVDPTAPDIHLGHTVVLRKLKHFQDMGHTAIFLIGDFSAMIGDPTGQSETRPPLSREQVEVNAKTYLAQVYKILDKEKTEVRYNSEWLGKMTSFEVVRLCGHYRLARMLEREDFRSRLGKNLPIAVHELLYPLLTAYDAVMLQSDVELGATEQKFNILVHREIQREYGLSPQVVMTMPILVGLDGERKMSKSLGNYVGITEAPGEMFGKLMSIPDDLMWSYYELVTDRTPQEIAELKKEVQSGELHPMDAKMKLAEEVVSDFQGADAGRKAAENFQRVFRDRQAPEEAIEVFVRWDTKAGGLWREDLKRRDITELGQWLPLSVAPSGIEKWSKLLVQLRRVHSTTEAERLIKQGAVEIDGNLLKDPSTKINLNDRLNTLVRVGKKQFFRLIIG
ncbi:MAG: tyrosine--tRNA ligase [Candidatus Acidiferrum sp.]